MPGMMDTILNLGINDPVEQALAAASPSPIPQTFARDTRLRFIRTYRRIVDPLNPPPANTYDQLRAAIESIFSSWNSPRAVAYRTHYGLDDQSGTAVIVQAMVFGNQGAYSGAGTLFSRNPITRESKLFGEWLPGGQGDDVKIGRAHV